MSTHKYNDKRLIKQIIKDHQNNFTYKQIGQRNNIHSSTAYWIVHKYSKSYSAQGANKTSKFDLASKDRPKRTLSKTLDNVVIPLGEHRQEQDKSQSRQMIPIWAIFAITGVIIVMMCIVFYAVIDTMDRMHDFQMYVD